MCEISCVTVLKLKMKVSTLSGSRVEMELGEQEVTAVYGLPLCIQKAWGLALCGGLSVRPAACQLLSDSGTQR